MIINVLNYNTGEIDIINVINEDNIDNVEDLLSTKYNLDEIAYMVTDYINIKTINL